MLASMSSHISENAKICGNEVNYNWLNRGHFSLFFYRRNVQIVHLYTISIKQCNRYNYRKGDKRFSLNIR